METREKILCAALALFNRDGLDNVSLRDIAAEAGIRQGNLTYHFKKRDDVVHALYRRLVEEIEREIVALSTIGGEHRAHPRHFLALNAAIYRAFDAYRFLMVDFAQIMRCHPRIAEEHAELTRRRRLQLRHAFCSLVEDGYMRPEQHAREHDLVIMQMTLIGDFFITGAEYVHHIPQNRQLSVYLELLSQLLSAYLTDEGRAALVVTGV